MMNDLPPTLDLNRLSFFSRWYGKIVTSQQCKDAPARTFLLGYWDNSGEASSISKAVVIIEEHERFTLQIRSALWRASEIGVERQNDWLIFSRDQNDLSITGLEDFLFDSRNLLEHLRDENKRLTPRS